MRLSQKWVVKLSNLPESGMGYQVVDITLKNGRVHKNILVYNCQEIKKFVLFREDQIVDIKIH